eukprot:Phypoly_transcript_06980.p1 GENE.Phypoly_transcript_06980~~Phypoly_transcript_06980.p1  ORF type:complete len:527 (+),score=94.26 Phypoly_transcript_06980:91-1671(+)
MDNITKGQISKAFSLQGLQLSPDAMKYIITLLQEKNDSGLLENILNAIDKNLLKKSLVDLEALKSTVDTLFKQSDSKTVEVESLKVINAFDVPHLRYNPHRRIFIPDEQKRPLHGDATAKADVFRERFTLIHQRLLLNPHFTAPILPTGEAQSHEYYQLTPIESLIGSQGRKCVLGMITQLKEGQYYLEDLRSNVRLDLSNATQPSGGMCCENSIVVAEGELIGDVFRVDVLGLPPAELAETSKQAHGTGVDFFGAAPHPSLVADLKKYETTAEDNLIVFVSDVWLDMPSVMEKLKTLFEGYKPMPPTAFVLMGNFTKSPLLAGDHMQLRTYFANLAALIASQPEIAHKSKFVLVPGPADPCGNVLNTVPRHPLPKVFAQPLLDRLPNSVTLATNPCRIRYCTQEIIVFRDDITNKMRRHCILEPKDEEFGLSQHLVKTLCDQSHLCPLPLTVHPVYWNYDHALHIYPLPDLLIIADKFASYDHKYRQCTAANPGNFSNDSSFCSFRPATREIELCSVDALDMETE